MGSNTFSILISITAGLGGLLFGYEIGVIGQVLQIQNFIDTFGTADQNTNAWVASLFQLGCVFGAAAFSILADTLGRKRSIIVSGTIFALGGVLQAVGSSLALLLVGRLVSGFAIGIASMVVPVYLAETASTSQRGMITVIYQLMITIGILIAAIVNTIIIEASGGVDAGKDWPWRLCMGIQAVPSVFLIILVSFIPFSPRWLAEKGRHDEGLETVAKLRGLTSSDAAAIEEYQLIKDNAEYEATVGNAGWGEVFSGSNRRRVAIGMVNQAFQQLTGINVILYFGPTLYKNLGFSATVSTEIMPIVFDFINSVCTFPGMYGIDKFGRRPLLQWGAVGMAVAHFCVFFSGQAAVDQGSSSLGGLALFFVAVFYFFFASTWGPVVWSYQSEIFPLRVRAKGTAICTMTNWGAGFIITWAFPQVQSALQTKSDVYWIFFSFCVAMGVWTYFAVPETKGLSLEEIGAVFGDKTVTSANPEIVKSDTKA
ncbi:High-affinity glucose transporter rgt2 [Physocladia obscura]|uniref:High-affinity glucose transporter rgt2 n=1 Tax=Physocladia obscura TaxID=109957 RepID=A0AAD5XIX5_9FUNG|nr:High-affinity glucose transporter rgt2 [Physocladia obscura]